MQVVLCDICGQQIIGRAFEWQMVPGNIATSEQTGTRIVRGQGGRVHFVCDRCTTWLFNAWEHLKEAHLTTANSNL